MPKDLRFFSKPIRYFQAIFGFLSTFSLLFLFSKLPKTTKQNLLWLLVGSFLSLLPVLASMPSMRQLLCASFGISAIAATLIMDCWERWKVVKGFERLQVVTLSIAYLVFSPSLLLYSQIQFAAAANTISALPLQSKTQIGKDSILITAPDHVIGVLYPVLTHQSGNKLPMTWRVLSMAPFDHLLSRIDDRTLVLTLPQGKMLASDIEVFWRETTRQYKPGDKVHLDGLTIQILESREGLPSKISYQFDHDLQNSKFDFLIWKAGALEKIALPQVGEALYIKKEPGPSGL